MALNRDGRGSVPSSGNRGASANKSNGNTTSARFLTPPGRMSFTHAFEPEETDTGPKYNVTLLFPPGTDLRALKDLLHDAMDAKFGDSKDWPKGARRPSDVFGDCGDKDYAGYLPGWTYVKFASSDAPGIVDARKEIVLEKREVYNGRWARVSGTAYAYDKKSKGCAFGLNNIQLLQNDDTFSGRPRAEDEFDDSYKDKVEASDRDRGGRDDDRGRGRDDDRDSDRGGRGRDRDEGDRGRDRDDDRGGRGRDDGRGGSRDRDDDRGSSRGRDEGHGRDRDEDRGGSDRERGRQDDGRPGGSDSRSRDDRGSRDRDENRGSGRDRDRDAPADRDRERGRSREDDRDTPRSRDADRAEPRSGRDRDDDRGSSRGSRDRDDDRGGSRGRSRDDNDRWNN